MGDVSVLYSTIPLFFLFFSYSNKVECNGFRVTLIRDFFKFFRHWLSAYSEGCIEEIDAQWWEGTNLRTATGSNTAYSEIKDEQAITPLIILFLALVVAKGAQGLKPNQNYPSFIS